MAISAGAGHATALLADGTVRVWGRNDHGQVGNGTTVENPPTVCLCVGVSTASGLPGPVQAVSAGGSHSIALLGGGSPQAWGENLEGELGNGSTTPPPGCECIPTPGGVAGLSSVQSVAAGEFHTLALLGDGSVRAWGQSAHGQLGDGSAEGNRSAPVAVGGLSGVSEVSAGGFTSFALIGPSHALTVSLAGAGAGAVGGPEGIICPAVNCVGSFPDSQVEILRAEAAPGSGFAGFTGACTGTGACQVKMDGDKTVTATFGPPKGTKITRGEDQTGKEAEERAPRASRSKAKATFSFTTPGVVSGYQCMLVKPKPKRKEGQARQAEGQTALRQMLIPEALQEAPQGPLHLQGAGAERARDRGTAGRAEVQGQALIMAARVTVGAALLLALCLAGLGISASAHAAGASALGWGANQYGQTGIGAPTLGGCECIPSPAPVSGLTDATQIVGGSRHSLALHSNGSVTAWGHNAHGQLGDGTTTASAAQVPVSGLANVVAVEASFEHSLALLANGTVVAWGDNEHGELGLDVAGPETCGASPCSKTPATVPGLSDVVAIDTGYKYSLALLANGTVMGWGDDQYGQFGDGTGVQSGCKCVDHPVQVPGVSGVMVISAGDDHAVALHANGTVSAWGENYNGQMGNGMPINTAPPECYCVGVVSVGGFSGPVNELSAGGYHNIAVLGSGDPQAWGFDSEGQLGNGTIVTDRLLVHSVAGCSPRARRHAVGFRGRLSHRRAVWRRQRKGLGQQRQWPARGRDRRRSQRSRFGERAEWRQCGLVG